MHFTEFVQMVSEEAKKHTPGTVVDAVSPREGNIQRGGMEVSVCLTPDGHLSSTDTAIRVCFFVVG